MLAGMKKGLTSAFAGAAAVLGLMGGAPETAQAQVSYESPTTPILLHKAQDTSIKTVVANFTGSFTVTPSDPSIVTQLAPEMANDPGYTYGMLVNPANNFGFIPNAGLLSTTSNGYTAYTEYQNVGQAKTTSVVADHDFQLFVRSNLQTPLSASSQITVGGYKPEYDSQTGDYLYTSFQPGWVKWEVPSGESLTFAMTVNANFQENCVGTTTCRGSGGALFSIETEDGYDSQYMSLTADSRNGSDYSGQITKTYTNTSDHTQTIRGQFNAQGQAFIRSSAVLNPGGTGITTDIYQISAVPEPGSAWLLSAALVLGAACRIVKNKIKHRQNADGDMKLAA